LNPETRAWLISELELWRDTFDAEYDEEQNIGWDTIDALINRFRTRRETVKDYQNAIFHLWQIAQGRDEG
jgi:hypothetical protein